MILDRLREWLARRYERCGDRMERWAKRMIDRADRCRAKSKQLSLDIEERYGRRLWRRW